MQNQTALDIGTKMEQFGDTSNPYVISIIITSNRPGDLLTCIESLEENTYRNHKLIILDNHSADGSIETIRSRYANIQILPLIENRGYAGNNNIGILAALEQGADWVFILNDDTVLAPDCLEHLVKTGTSDPQIGITGPMVYHHDEPAVIQSAGGLLGPDWSSLHIAKNDLDVGQITDSHLVDWISGCAILARTEMIRQVGGFDERFFLYWEETEWCLRGRKAGWKISHVPQAKIWHKGVQRNYRPQPHVTYYHTRNRFLLMAKHQAPLGAWLAAAFQTARSLSSWTIRPKWRVMRLHRNAMFRGVLDFINHRWGPMSF